MELTINTHVVNTDEEELLRENPLRFVLFPIKYDNMGDVQKTKRFILVYRRNRSILGS